MFELTQTKHIFVDECADDLSGAKQPFDICMENAFLANETCQLPWNVQKDVGEMELCHNDTVM